MNSDISSPAMPSNLKDNSAVAPTENLEKTFQITVTDFELSVIANSLADAIGRSWLFDPEGTINDDVVASYEVLKLLKKINGKFSPDKRIGCVVEKYLPFEGGDIYINALYRIDTTVKGKVIAVATFSYDKDIIAFKLFDPIKYPNAKKLSDCLGDKIPMDDIQSIQEVNHLTDAEKEGFCKAIKNAWCVRY